jgi:hypothetical protein
VDRQQRAHSAATHVSNILCEDGRKERAVPAVGVLVQQLRCHIRLKLSPSSLRLSLSLRLGLSLGLRLGLRLRLGLSLSLVHSCSCIQKLNLELKRHINSFFNFVFSFSFLKQQIDEY